MVAAKPQFDTPSQSFWQSPHSSSIVLSEALMHALWDSRQANILLALSLLAFRRSSCTEFTSMGQVGPEQGLWASDNNVQASDGTVYIQSARRRAVPGLCMSHHRSKLPYSLEDHHRRLLQRFHSHSGSRGQLRRHHCGQRSVTQLGTKFWWCPRTSSYMLCSRPDTPGRLTVQECRDKHTRRTARAEEPSWRLVATTGGGWTNRAARTTAWHLIV